MAFAFLESFLGRFIHPVRIYMEQYVFRYAKHIHMLRVALWFGQPLRVAGEPALRFHSIMGRPDFVLLLCERVSFSRRVLSTCTFELRYRKRDNYMQGLMDYMTLFDDPIPSDALQQHHMWLINETLSERCDECLEILNNYKLALDRR